MRITCTNGNSINKIPGSRISVYNSKGYLVDRFVVPARYGTRYCENHPNGKYAKRLESAKKKALK